MSRESIQLFFSADTENSMVEQVLNNVLSARSDLRSWHLGRNLEGSWGAGAYTLDLTWDAGAANRNPPLEFAHIRGFERADRVCYQSIGSGARDAGLSNGIWRTLLLRVRPGANPKHVPELEQDLLRMPQYMQGIRNWNLGKVTSPSSWTHVWQQEYTRIDDLLGEYLLHPFHWGWVDRWFDAEFPEWTIDHISHAFCPLQTSILTNDT